MNEALRKERIGLVKAAALLRVTVSRLRHAVDTDGMLNGRQLPKPVIRNGGPRPDQTVWYLGDLADFMAGMPPTR